MRFKTILLFMVFAFLGQVILAQSYVKDVDGIPSDWIGIPSETPHATVIDEGEWIYTGVVGDQRTDIRGYNDDNDITEVRITTDGTYLYYMVKSANLGTNERVYLSMSFDTDLDPTDTEMVLNCPSGDLFIGRPYRSEINVAVHDVIGGGGSSGGGRDIQTELLHQDSPLWYAPPSGDNMQIMLERYNTIEGRINLEDLGLTSADKFGLALATFVNDNTHLGSNYNNDRDATIDIEGSDDAIDAMTPDYPGDPTDDVVTRDLFDNDIDYVAVINLCELTEPVEMSEFYVDVRNNGNKLYWREEYKVDAFELEKSYNMVDWVTLAWKDVNSDEHANVKYSWFDKEVNCKTAYYRLKNIVFGELCRYSQVLEVLPEDRWGDDKVILSDNYPNPFNPETNINFIVPDRQHVVVKVYNSIGMEVGTLYNDIAEANTAYNLRFNGNNLASGVYYCRLTSDNLNSVKKMILLK